MKDNLYGIDIEKLSVWWHENIPSITATTLNWIAVVLLHLATVPALLSVLWAWNDTMPPLDIVLMTWAGLVALFCQACVQRNMLLIVTNAMGFVLQSSLVALIFFR